MRRGCRRWPTTRRPPADDRAVGDEDLLVRQFAAEDGARRLGEYLDAKHAVCQESAGLERAADGFRSDRPRTRRPDLDPGGVPRGVRDASQWARVFRAHAEDAAITLGPSCRGPDARCATSSRCAHADTPRPTSGRGRPHGRLDRELPQRWAADPARATTDALDLATIRQAAARDAINAIALAEVVAALTARSIPIRCPIIADGTPAAVPLAARPSGASSRPRRTRGTTPTLTLLGPSESLVAQALEPAAPG